MMGEMKAMEIHVDRDLAYLKQKKIYIEKQRCAVERILDDKFDMVYDFFYAVLVSKKRYKILRARRCQVLFYIFYPIILLEEEELKANGIFISHNSMIKHKESILNSSALLVDDILIHGRGLKQIYEILDENYEHENITTFVLYQSKDAKKTDKRFWEKVRCIREVFDWEWVELSCQFVNMIYASTSPYISFVGSYVKFGNGKYNICESSFLVHDNTNDAQKQQGEKAIVLYEKNGMLPFFTRLSYDCCLRIYENEEVEKATYIPYVFLKNFDVKTIKKLFGWICEKINSHKIAIIQADLLKNFDSKEGNEYQTMLFVALINQIYGLYLQNKYLGVLNGAIVDNIALSIIYGTEIAEELCHITYEDIQPVLFEKMPDIYEDNGEEDSELKQIWDNLNSEIRNSNIGDLSLFFYKNRMIDEERADKLLERKIGLTVGYFYNTTPIENWHIMSSGQLSKWDSGVASCCVHENKGQLVASYNAAGEQSFRYVLDKFSSIMNELIFLYNKPLFDATEESGVDLVLARMKELRKEKEKHKKYSEEEWEALEVFINKNIYRLGAWRVPQV